MSKRIWRTENTHTLPKESKLIQLWKEKIWQNLGKLKMCTFFSPEALRHCVHRRRYKETTSITTTIPKTGKQSYMYQHRSHNVGSEKKQVRYYPVIGLISIKYMTLLITAMYIIKVKWGLEEYTYGVCGEERNGRKKGNSENIRYIYFVNIGLM